MGENNSRLDAFEARLAQLRNKMEAGLSDRAARIEQHVQLLDIHEQQASARDGLRHEAHKLRGVAGTFSHVALGELAGELEQIALVGSREVVAKLARVLINAVRCAGLTVSAPATNNAATTGDASTKPMRRRVLAIDDDPDTRTLLDLTLRQLGRFDSLILMSGTDALDHLTRERFDLVLCDAMMPDMNGLTLCERARHLKTTHPVPPIVILSAATRDELGWNIGTEYAPFDWWRKPFRPKLLVGQINSLLNAR